MKDKKNPLKIAKISVKKNKGQEKREKKIGLRCL